MRVCVAQEDIIFAIGVTVDQVAGLGSKRHVASIRRDGRFPRTAIPLGFI